MIIIKENQIKKRKNNIKDNITITKNDINLITFIIINLFCKIKSYILYDFFHFQYSSKIILKVKGIGENYIFGNNYYTFNGFDFLKDVYINGIKQNIKTYKYYFNQTDNVVELIWDDNINNCENMFWKCANITEINVTNFNTSQVTNMGRFFGFCSSLTTLDLSNFNTFQANDMNCMFCGCSSLTSLDLSNFDTSKVTSMLQMFDDCAKLKYIIISYNNWLL